MFKEYSLNVAFLFTVSRWRRLYKLKIKAFTILQEEKNTSRKKSMIKSYFLQRIQNTNRQQEQDEKILRKPWQKNYSKEAIANKLQQRSHSKEAIAKKLQQINYSRQAIARLQVLVYIFLERVEYTVVRGKDESKRVFT